MAGTPRKTSPRAPLLLGGNSAYQQRGLTKERHARHAQRHLRRPPETIETLRSSEIEANDARRLRCAAFSVGSGCGGSELGSGASAVTARGPCAGSEGTLQAVASAAAPLRRAGG